MKKELHLVNDMEQLHCLHDFIDQVSSEIGLSPHTSINLKLALEEAVVNVISYAYPGETGKDICLLLETQPGKIKFILTDTGHPFNPVEKPEPDISLSGEQRPIGGLGIFLVKKLMSQVTYERAGDKNILTLIKEIT
ncbi:MAG: ATP-binding protein [Tannerellaceae bacterium]|nr:ATP-binding protein [Tannerellaceae bacterium]